MMKDQLFSKRLESSPSFIKEPAFHIKVFCAYVQMIDGKMISSHHGKYPLTKAGSKSMAFFA